ncbi:MAG: Rpn family recombination-promoting nuclease/putative transposase [Synergistaceae bacterium]|nr:Rpn family recombination-promoting nuclease/putative transposase [Synergistaceae bacterium]MBR0098020.1 Rpn family recombination-promoting nuclease/putative transposase [Synergistaceae bacterium]
MDEKKFKILADSGIDIDEALRRSTLMDDVYMRIFFHDNIPCVELALRIIMNKPDLTVKKLETQYELNGADKSRSVIFDIYAVDGENTEYDIEIQRGSSGAVPQRARYNSAMLDVNILKAGQDFRELKRHESVVIFITEKDVLGDGEAIYVIERVNIKTGKLFNDGTHIIYVNASRNADDTDLGRLMHDFTCREPDKMHYNLFAERARTVAEERMEKQMTEMAATWDRIYEIWTNDAREEATKRAERRAERRAKIQAKRRDEQFLLNMINNGVLSLDKLSAYSGIEPEKILKFAEKKGFNLQVD